VPSSGFLAELGGLTRALTDPAQDDAGRSDLAGRYHVSRETRCAIALSSCSLAIIRPSIRRLGRGVKDGLGIAASRHR
jgi:hypothetical protein